MLSQSEMNDLLTMSYFSCKPFWLWGEIFCVWTLYYDEQFFSRIELDQVRRGISEVSLTAPPDLTHNRFISDCIHFPGLFQKFNFGAYLLLGWSLLGALGMGGGGCEKALGMAGEMLCSSSVAPLVPFQSQPLVLTDLGLSHNRFRHWSHDAMWLNTNAILLRVAFLIGGLLGR